MSNQSELLVISPENPQTQSDQQNDGVKLDDDVSHLKYEDSGISSSWRVCFLS